MFPTIIVSVYKDLTALKLILEALTKQTYKNFEVIVAEDGESDDIFEYLKNLKIDLDIKHIRHEDIGNRKGVMTNNAVRESKGDYLIYLDGDSIPFSTFVDAHVKLSSRGNVLCGRRINLGVKVSNDLRDGKRKAYDLEKNYFSSMFYLLNDNIKDYEQGIYIKPNTILEKFVHKFDKNVHMLGSNYSCYKDDMLLINGHDEKLLGGVVADDTDAEWRFKSAGINMKTCKFSANVMHLYHEVGDRTELFNMRMEIVREKQQRNAFFTDKGIK